MHTVPASGSLRLLILTPSLEEGNSLAELLRARGIETQCCATIGDLRREYAAGAGAALIAADYFVSAADEIQDMLRDQPVWSDFPLLGLMEPRGYSVDLLDSLVPFGNVALVSHPIDKPEFISLVQARLRDRKRQYATRDLIAQRDEALKTSLTNERRLTKALLAGSMAAWEWRSGSSYWSESLYDLLGIERNIPAGPDLFFRYVHPADRERVLNEWELATRGEGTYDAEFRIVRPDGEVRWLRGIGDVVRDDAGNVKQIYGLNWDITRDCQLREELHQANAAASSANKAKSDFLAKMSHEIRTPMSAVLGYAEVLLRQEKSPEKSRCLEAIKRNGEFLIEIINDILDLSKIEAGKLDIQREWFDPREIVADVETMMRIRADKSRLDLNVRYEGFVPSHIYSDAKRLRQILINLVGNAIKFTEYGSVTLIVRCRHDVAAPRMEFAVIDTGIGIAADQMERLFQTFSQANSSVDRHYGGTGLGLAISKQLATLLGGDVTCQSSLGMGSTFTLTVDAGDISGRAIPEASFNRAPEESLAGLALKCRALIVDDRRDVRFLAQHVLEEAGATVILADDGEQALEVYRQQCSRGEVVDLVVLDMQMPRLDGYSTAQQLRSLGYDRPIIALTADAMAGDRQRSIEAGCNAYLCKPIDRRELLQTAHRLLRELEQAVSSAGR
jgi:PAS domain S-box-containing protein